VVVVVDGADTSADAVVVGEIVVVAVVSDVVVEEVVVGEVAIVVVVEVALSPIPLGQALPCVPL
jgi:hypothetical protein